MSFHGLTAHFFLTLNSIPLPGYTIVHLFIHLHHGCSQVLAIMNSAAIHICAQVFVWTQAFTFLFFILFFFFYLFLLV